MIRHRRRRVKLAAKGLAIFSLLLISSIVILQTQSLSTASIVTKPTSQNSTTTATKPPDQQQQPQQQHNNNQLIAPANNCTSPCSSAEFSAIIKRLSQDGSPMSIFQTSSSQTSATNDEPAIRAECVRELIGLIRNLASDEVEMKSVLEFASGSGPLQTSGSPLIGKNSRVANQDRDSVNSNCTSPLTTAVDEMKQQSATRNQQQELLFSEQESGSSDPRSKVLPKVVSTVNHYIDSVERFTLTKEWSSLLKVFKGVESILSLFVPNTNKTSSSVAKLPTVTFPPPTKNYGQRLQQSNATSSDNSTTAAASTTTVAPPKINGDSTSNKKTSRVVTKPTPAETEAILVELRENLPVELQTLTNSLGSLFPWHVWPWNNIDLYATIETFLNHGIFAFGKTTSGPERRIDYLTDMLQTLFNSLKFESFPKKCNDWSKVICDPEKFHDRLVLGPGSESSPLNQTARDEKIRELMREPRNQLTGELTCIMFSSLSMQQFGASAKDLQGQDEAALWAASSRSINQQPLAWDRLVHKGLKLYGLAREALTDKQWNALYDLLNDLWKKQKISDRVIMVGRIVQLLTNCHMPREMLESALWKDIYKYKNAMNQLSDIVIEELNRSAETGKFSIDQLSLGSKNLNEILVRFMRLLPKLIEALSRTVVDQLPDLVNKFFTDKISFFQTPCKGSSLSDLIVTLEPHRNEILELEELICAQLNTKPSFSMMQINNLTNELLAMAFNFTNFNQAFAIPAEILSNLQNPGQLVPTKAARPAVKSSPEAANSGDLVVAASTNNDSSTGDTSGFHMRENVTSIVDELVANPRLAAIVAILQSSPLDPPEVHAELPELDWVEAGTSVALLYESIQRLMSFEGLFVIFPEVENFQDELQASVDKSNTLFKKFSKRDPIRLFAYALDAVMPVSIRTFKPMNSFYAECQTTLRDLFNQVPEGPSTGGSDDMTNSNGSSAAPNQQANSKDTRQWQCIISSLNFGAHALNKLIATFNSMLESVLAQASALNSIPGVQSHAMITAAANSGKNQTNGCLLFDGSLTKLLDNWPQVMELALESVLVASTSSSEQQVGLYDTICNGNYSLDPFSSQMNQQEVQRTRAAMCRLASKSSLADCAEVLKLDEWKSTMQQLNATWFESNAIQVEPAFRATTLRVHEFLILFGRAKPSSWSDSLLARALNVNSFWDSLLNKTVNTIERYQERRLELGLQTLEPIVYDNLSASSSCRPITTISASSDSSQQTSFNSQETCNSTRKVLITSIATAHAIINHMNSTKSQKTPHNGSSIELRMQTLFELADNYSLPAAETFLRTVAINSAKLESLLELNTTKGIEENSVIDFAQVFDRFCAAPIDKYLQFEGTQPETEVATKEQPEVEKTRQLMLQFQTNFCKFNWTQFNEQLVSRQISDRLSNYPIRQLTRVALTKWGQVFDLILSLSSTSDFTIGPQSTQTRRSLPNFLQVQHWQPFHAQLSLITPLKEQPSNFIWIWQGIERLFSAAEGNRNQLTDAFSRTFDQLNCALDSVKGGLSWENLANIYSDRQDILAAHSTINNGFVLASIGVSTFMAPKKFQRLLDEFVRPIRQPNNITGASTVGFCEMRDRSKWENILALPNEAVDFAAAIESFQELVCDTNFETLPQSINPISVCYQTTNVQPSGSNSSSGSGKLSSSPLAETLDRSFKLASLAAMDAKLVAANDARPPIFDKSQWSSFWDWWSTQPAAEPRGGLALALVRAFQTLDSMNFGHVVWRAVFKSVHEMSEILAYLVRATEQRQQQAVTSGSQQVAQIGSGKLAAAVASSESVKVKSSSAITNKIQPQQVVSTLSSLMFPEASNLIPLKTFKQLRYIKAIADYYTVTPEAQESICKHQTGNTSLDHQLINEPQQQQATKIELIGYKLSSGTKLNTLLCHYHASQWLTALNIVISARTSSLSKRVNLMTKYLSLFTKQYKDFDHLESFIHARQMDNIETVANATVSHLLAASYSLRGSLSFAKLSNISWNSMPTVLESIDKQLCDNSQAEFGIHNLQQLISFKSFAMLEPKKPDLETLVCKLPQWNVSQIYDYLSESFDLQKMISLVTQPMQQQQQQTLDANNQTIVSANSTIDLSPSKLLSNFNLSSLAALLSKPGQTQQQQQQQQQTGSDTCTTPFKLASKWLKVIQDTIAQAKSKSSREKIRKCLSGHTKNQSFCAQSLRYFRVINKLLTSINDLTGKNSWVRIRKTWNSISYHLINTNQQQTSAHPPVIKI